MNKKGAVAIIAIILALIVFAIVLIYFAKQECYSNRDCPDNAYCGSDHECHLYPESLVIKETNYLPAAVILGASILGAAYIFRGKRFPYTIRKRKE